jgi:hypothetical protein
MDDMTAGRSATTRNGEYVVSSIDGGRTWESPVALSENPAGGSAFEHIGHVVTDSHSQSPFAGSVYVLWTRNYFDERQDEIVIARSSDSGAVWSMPAVIGTEALVLAAAVGHDGAVYAMNVSFDADVSRPSWNHGWSAAVNVSDDGGETFAKPLSDVRPAHHPSPRPDRAEGNEYAFPRSFGWPVMDIDPRDNGRIYVVWGDCRHGDRDVFCAASEDRGRTWSDPVRVNDDTVGNGKDQLTQCVAVDPSDGSLYVAFYDRRYDPDNRYPTVTLARSTDGGSTFENYTWGDVALRPEDACFGDYIGIAARNGLVYGAWVEDVASEPGPPKPLETVTSGSMELRGGDWPYGPSAIRVGIADFR